MTKRSKTHKQSRQRSGADGQRPPEAATEANRAGDEESRKASTSIEGSSDINSRPELLAPVGHIESFFAALENGADAVYLGLRRLSARASATNFSLEDLAHLLPYAHQHQISVYVALNSVLTAPEFPGVMDLLQSLSDLQVDALIVQDPGLFFLVRRFFPQLKLHASTLMTIHNRAGVNQLERMGAERVVLARELNLEELGQIARSTRAELEIFVHGALCYSYSGLCLTSSFRGGHSGLQGRCVQPCRLCFKQGRKEGFFLSCGDMCALPVLPRLKRLRISSFKIEGRMKSADYIAQVVKSYRLVLDAPPEGEAEAVARAQEWLLQAPSRRLTSGFFSENCSDEVLAPHISGSSGLWIGTVKGIRSSRPLVELRREIKPGDRLRPESSEGKEKDAFTVTQVFSENESPLELGRSGDRVFISPQSDVKPGERLFKVGVQANPASSLWQKIRKEGQKSLRFSTRFAQPERVWKDWPDAFESLHRAEETLILKVGSPQDMLKGFQSPAQWVMLTATRSNLEKIAKQRLIPAQKSRLTWSLPPLISEKEIEYYRAAISWYLDKGFPTWEINNWGHLDFFKGPQKTNLISGCRFNVRNPAAMAALAEEGCRWSVLSLEITREELQHLSRGPCSTIPIVTVYAWPPLFTSRLIPKLMEEKPIFTPRKDVYFFKKSGSYSLIYADRPLNWFEQLSFLREQGYRFLLLDLSDAPQGQPQDFERVLSGFRRARADQPFSLFNFERKP
jgi:putative protease